MTAVKAAVDEVNMDIRYKPLADEIRPTSLDDVVGQKHILGEHGMLRRIVLSGSIPNMIFYGPSGTGKTTVARIIAERTSRTLRKLNATTAGIGDIKQIIDELDTFLTPGGVLLYLDEISTRSSISTKSSSRACWSLWRTGASPSLPLPQKTLISVFSGLC